ncbi:MAG TPA: crosslink repair DNA glycosylase YcaQ family protein [Thermoplasmata archaeon]|nr:crosslink repair DNA glycosylase YcaQ family protein [Thermoplasmata archaeon]
MPEKPPVVSLQAARRLAIAKQRLDGRRASRPSREAIVELVRSLPYVQWDPVSVVAPSHLLSLWARLGAFAPAELERLLWQEKRLFLHWTPIASLVAMDDFPLYASLMRRYPDSLSSSWGSHRTRAREYLARHASLRRTMLRELEGGPLTLAGFGDHGRTRRAHEEWAPSSDVAQMLHHLLMSGDIMVVGHEGNQNLWGLASRFLPPQVDRRELSEKEVDREAAERALLGLGVARPDEVAYYFVRGRYRDVRRTLAALEDAGRVQRVQLEGAKAHDTVYVHRDDLALLDRLETQRPEARVAILPPFDNLVYHPARGRRLFAFDYVREQFLPKEKRRFGLWVLPLVYGERFVGRLDTRLDKERGILRVNAVFAERGAPTDRAVAVAIREEIDRLAEFLGAGVVAFGSRVPAAWRPSLH